MKWQKGSSGNPSGLPAISDNVSLEYWLRKVEKQLNSKGVPVVERIRLELEVIKLLLNRNDVPTHQTKPERTEKKKRFSLEDLENERPGTVAGGTASLGDGPAEVQAFKDSAGD